METKKIQELVKKFSEIREELSKAKKMPAVPPVTIDPADHPSSISSADAIKMVKEESGDPLECSEALKTDANGQWSLHSKKKKKD
jgi:hypothetical protein